MAAFWCYFRDFVGAQKIEDLTESNFFFAEVFQITSRFILVKKKLGLGALQINLSYSLLPPPLRALFSIQITLIDMQKALGQIISFAFLMTVLFQKYWLGL